MLSRTFTTAGALAAVALTLGGVSAYASSHMDAPSTTLDVAANTTDLYAFVSDDDGTTYLSTALAVFPFEEPGIGPNAYRFDDNVRYEIHVSLGDDVAAGKPTLTYRFDFETDFTNDKTILQAYLGDIVDVGDAAQNLIQTYSVTRVDRRLKGKKKREKVLGTGIVPPNNQGNVTPFYNQQDNGESPARDGVATDDDLDRYTAQAIQELDDGYRAFAGQRDDGFFADIQAIFDRLRFRTSDPSFDSQGGFNVHTLALDIPVAELGGEMQQIGVFATTSRRRLTILNTVKGPKLRGRWIQVARQGNPLFCEAFVALEDKDLYNRTMPSKDRELFEKYALSPELAVLANAFLGLPFTVIEQDRTDLAGIFIPDLIKVDLSTGPARLAGGGEFHATNPDDTGFSRLGIFGASPDVLFSQIQDGFGGGQVSGGFPNGRRFGDDVVDIAITALISDLRDPAALVINSADGIDRVSSNDIAYNKVFPYAATPLNGRNHGHN